MQIPKRGKRTMKTSDDTLVTDKIVTDSGREFHPVHKDILDKIPAEIVTEMAKRRLEEIETDKKK
jgi:hypothetical protein